MLALSLACAGPGCAGSTRGDSPVTPIAVLLPGSERPFWEPIARAFERYRSDMLQAARLSPPRTFADLIHVARTLDAPPVVWGFVWQGKQYEGLVCNYLEVLSGCGGYWVDPSTLDVGLDQPQALEALAFMVSCLRRPAVSPPGVTTYEEEESRRLFQDGRAVFLRSWPYTWRLAQMTGSPLRGRVGVLPMVHAPGGSSAGTLGGWGLGISAYSRHPRLALAFVRRPPSGRTSTGTAITLRTWSGDAR